MPMPKALFIAEKPSVAQEFAKALHEPMTRNDGFLESERAVVTWCVGHLVTMSYPEVYDPELKKWTLETLPFIPEEFRYELIPAVKKQFNIVKSLMHRKDVDRIYICTDSGREGEYIYRLVAQMAGVPKTTKQLRVWIDSQTEEEIRRGIQNAKDDAEYNNLSDAAYLRAKEDYLMGINFSRLLSVKYGYEIRDFLGDPKIKIAVGRVMTCVLGMVVRREREIRSFVKMPFYKLILHLSPEGGTGKQLDTEWRVTDDSRHAGAPYLYRNNGFKEKAQAEKTAADLMKDPPVSAQIGRIGSKKEKVNPASGCLPLFIQIPIFFSLYKVLNIAIEIRHAPFIGWVKDLSAPDPLTISVWSHIPYIPSLLDIGVWPLIYGLTMLLQNKLNPKPANKDQARMFMLMPIVFTLMFAHFAVGLVIYWTLNNVLSLIQQKVIMRKNGVQ